MLNYIARECPVGAELDGFGERVRAHCGVLGWVLLFVLFLCGGVVERAEAAPSMDAGVNRTVPKVTPPATRLTFSATPTDADFLRTGLFTEPLAPVAETTVNENRDLAHALLAYRDATRKSGANDAVDPILAFLTAHPDSAWKPVLQLDLGIIYRQTGHFSKALEIWQTGWNETKGLTDPRGQTVANALAARLSQLEAYLGRKELLQPLLDSIKPRSVGGTSEQLITDSNTGLYDMLHHPEDSFRCGPLALTRIATFSSAKPSPATLKVLDEAHSTDHGLSLSMVQEVATKAGMPYQMAFRSPGAAILMPAVAHWKVGHYAAIVNKVDGRLVVEDSTFGEDIRVSPSTLDEEASGYFLVRAGALPKGWRKVSKDEGDRIWGRGNTGQNHDNGATGNQCDGGDGCTSPTVEPEVVGLQLNDVPVGYTPPVGPAVRFHLVYSHRDAEQPTTGFPYTNFGPKWTLNWVSYVNVGSSSSVLYRRGGGTEPFMIGSANISSAPGPYSTAFMGFNPGSTSSAFTGLTITNPDGSTEEYNQPNAAGTQYFLSAVSDAAGNTVTLTYDSQMRIVAITDAIGQVSTLTYGLASNPTAVTKITDPFGRSATFTYTADGHLGSITDTLGITSSYTYGQARASGIDPDFVNTLTTPYGTTTFTFGDVNTNASLGDTRFLKTVDPLGRTSYVEFNQGVDAGDTSNGSLKNGSGLMPTPTGMLTCNQYLNYRNTFIFDANQYALATQGGSLNYSMAHVIHWLHTSDGQAAARFRESEKQPLENRVWYNYPSQPSCIYAPVSNSNTVTPGGSIRPTYVARVLDNGATQVQSFTYNAQGNLLTATDPVNRQMTYTYATNGIDLLKVSNTTGGAQQLLNTYTYNNIHRPLTSTGANGKTQHFQYNAAGENTRYTNQAGHSTALVYDQDGRLKSITGAIGGATYTFAYDSVSRVAAATDPAGSTLRFSYDAADRLTSVTFPDGTSSTNAYTLLDRTSSTDRLSQTTHYQFDSDRELMATTDPLGHSRQFGYTLAGVLSSITDENNHTTTLIRDGQNRLIQKRQADGTSEIFAYQGALSLVATITDALGQVTSYVNNTDNTVAAIGYNSTNPTAAVSFAYDPAYRRLVSMTDGVGTTTYSYYPVSSATLGANQLKSVSSPVAGTTQTDTVAYSYDALNRVVSYSVNGVPESFGFDALGRVTSVANALDTFSYSYSDGTRRITGVTSGSGPAIAMSYFGPAGDELLKQISITTNSGATSLSQFSYTYDANDNLTGETVSALSLQTTNYTYDAVNRLTAGTLAGSSSPQYAYGYDAASNLTSITNGGSAQSFTYTSTNTDVSAVYDANGSPTSLGANTYTWDGVNRIASVSNSVNSTSSSFTYDGLGRLVRIVDSSNGVVTADHSYTWCGAARCLAHDNTQSGSPVSTQYFSQGVIAAGTPYYYVKDLLGSVNALVTGSGSVASQFTYDPYGNRTTVSGTVISDIGYAGYFYHAGSGLDFALNRAYDPVHARWLNRDPIGEAGGLNLYGYVGGRPVSQNDPSGLFFDSAAAQAAEEALARQAAEEALADAAAKAAVEAIEGGGNPVSDAVALATIAIAVYDVVESGGSGGDKPPSPPAAGSTCPDEPSNGGAGGAAGGTGDAGGTGGPGGTGGTGGTGGAYSGYSSAGGPKGLATNVGPNEFSANLQANGYTASPRAGTNGPVTVLQNGQGSTWTVYTRSSTGLSGAQYSGPDGQFLKYNLGQQNLPLPGQ